MLLEKFSVNPQQHLLIYRRKKGRKEVKKEGRKEASKQRSKKVSKRALPLINKKQIITVIRVIKNKNLVTVLDDLSS